jgi:hypothetical protein
MDVKGRKRYDVAMLCEYEITAMGAIAQDVGYGIGQSYSSFADAFESAAKEAVTDALKRCLRTWGNRFGNCLYDKKWLKENGNKPPKGNPRQEAEDFYEPPPAEPTETDKYRAAVKVAVLRDVPECPADKILYRVWGPQIKERAGLDTMQEITAWVEKNARFTAKEDNGEVTGAELKLEPTP